MSLSALFVVCLLCVSVVYGLPVVLRIVLRVVLVAWWLRSVF